MDIFSLRALWLAIKGRSLTFALVFATAVMGSSFAGLIRVPLRTLGLWWPLLFFLPIVIIALLAKHERKLPVEESFRRRCSLILVAGPILLSLLLWRYEVYMRTAYTDSFQPGPRFKEQPQTSGQPPRPQGPRHRRP